MKYKVIEGFYDLQDPEGRDGYHLYNKGDIYPRKGLEPTEERIAKLAGRDNKLRHPLIEEITEEAVEETVPEAFRAEEAPKKRRSKKAQ